VKVEVSEAIVNLQLEIRKLQELSSGDVNPRVINSQLLKIGVIALNGLFIGMEDDN
jgi:hypothetical protein